MAEQPSSSFPRDARCLIKDLVACHGFRERSDVGCPSLEEAEEAFIRCDFKLWEAVTKCALRRFQQLTHLKKSLPDCEDEEVKEALTNAKGDLCAAFSILKEGKRKPYTLWGPDMVDLFIDRSGQTRKNCAAEMGKLKPAFQSSPSSQFYAPLWNVVKTPPLNPLPQAQHAESHGRPITKRPELFQRMDQERPGSDAEVSPSSPLPSPLPLSLPCKPAGVAFQQCQLCVSNGESLEFARSHRLKDDIGRVICPVLRKYTCPYCLATGDHAHTKSYCPMVNPSGKRAAAIAVQLKNTPRNASGRSRKQ